MDDRSLSLFVQVCECESISKAATQNYLSRQSLTQIMNSLEHEVGVQLFERSHTGIALTNAGKFFLSHVRTRLLNWNAVLAEMKAIHSARKIIHVGCRTTLMSDDFLYEFVRQCDENDSMMIIMSDTPTDDCWELLRQRKLDLAYTLNPRGDLKLVSRSEIGHLKGAYVIMAKNHEASSVDTLDSSSLADTRVLLTADSTGANTTVNEYLRRAQAQILPIPANHNLHVNLIERDNCIALVPGSAVMHFSSPDLIAKPLSDFPRILHQHLVYNQDSEAEIINACDILAKKLYEYISRIPYEQEANGTIHFL